MSRKICEIGCGATGEAFVPQFSVKGSSLTCSCRVRGHSQPHIKSGDEHLSPY